MRSAESTQAAVARRRHDVVTVGESLGLLVAERNGPLQHVPTMRLGFGGAESNVAIGVSRLGGSAAWIGRLGNDSLARLIRRELLAEAVAVHAPEDSGDTALMLKERPRPGQTRVSYYRRGQAGSRLVPQDIPEEVIAQAEVLHLTGITPALGEGPLQAMRHAAACARANGTRISFDVNHRRSLWSEEDAVQLYREFAAQADVVFAGEDEAELLTGAVGAEAQLHALVTLGARQAVVKRGPGGAVALDQEGRAVSRDALQVEVVDTVGAGDAFVAGWLHEWVCGAEAGVRLDVAVACGAAACTAEGDWEALPTRKDLRDLLAEGTDPVIR